MSYQGPPQPPQYQQYPPVKQPPGYGSPYGSPPVPAPQRRPRSKKWIASFAIVLVGMILAVATIFLAWFSANVLVDMDTGVGPSLTMSANFDFGLSSVTISGTSMGIQQTSSMSYGSIQSMISNYLALSGLYGLDMPSNAVSQINAIFNTFGMTQLFVLIGLILAILAVILIAVAGLTGRIPGAVGGILGLIGSTFMLLAPIYLAIVLPISVNNFIAPFGEQISFMGSYSYLGNTITWGPGIGWFLAFVAFIVLFAGSAMAFSIKRTPPEPLPAPLPLYMQPTPAQYVPPQPWPASPPEQQPPQPGPPGY